MYIQQIKARRHQVTGSDGRTRTVAVMEPEVDAQSLRHGGKEYPTHGNGVFHVPDSLGQSLLGGMFRDVTSPPSPSTVMKPTGGGDPVLQEAPQSLQEAFDATAPVNAAAALSDEDLAALKAYQAEHEGALPPAPVEAEKKATPVKKAAKKAGRPRGAARKK